MGFMKRVAADLARFAAIASVVAVSWIAAYYAVQFIHWGPITGVIVATGAAVLNGVTMGYNLSPLDTED